MAFIPLTRLSRAVFAALTLAFVAAAAPAGATAPQSMEMAGSHGRFLGKPDLTLTSSMVSAGGGTANFHSVRLLTMLTAQHHNDEIRRLQRRFGAARVVRFTQTFDAFVALALHDAAAHDIALPAPQYVLEHDPYVLAASLRRSGVMPDGRYDVGYMLEHLLSRPMHVRLMNEVNENAAVGPAINADFHIILTSAMDDLKTLYSLPQ